MNRWWYALIVLIVLAGIGFVGMDVNEVSDLSSPTSADYPKAAGVETAATSHSPVSEGQAFTLSSQTKSIFDRLIFANEGAERPELIAAFKHWLDTRNIVDERDYAVSLFTRYLDYKAALQHIDSDITEVSTASLKQVEQRLQALKDTRYRYFSDIEYTFFFADDSRFDEAALARLRIATDADLPRDTRQQLIDEHLNALPDEQKAAFADSLNARSAQQIRNDYTSPSARYNALAAEFGHEAANRIAERWQAQDAWQERVSQVVNMRQRLKSGTDSESLKTFINENFSEQEQRRLRVYLENPALLRGD